MYLLDVLIPTYGRPKNAKKAIDSCLDSNDDRCQVICNSNGYEHALECYRASNKNIIYSNFDENQGPTINFSYLLNKTTAKYCMLLSDEDYLDASLLKNFLDYLEGLDSSVSVISCSVFSEESNSYFYSPKIYSDNGMADINEALMLLSIPSYMSGYVFTTSKLKSINLKEIMNPSIANAYPHINITHELLHKGRLSVYKELCVIKGKDVQYGGDAYSHKSNLKQEKKVNNLDMNPYVYGPKALVRQFYYLEKKLYESKKYMRVMPYISAVLLRMFVMHNSIINSDRLVILEMNTTIESELVMGIIDAKNSRDFSGSFFSNFFKYIFYLNPFFVKILYKVIKIIIINIGRIEVKINSGKI
jgi:glycosyltransferase involved in cell wall biosynthesis